MRRDADALSRFFGRVAREAYGELGVGDEASAAYVADLLARFARTEGVYRLRDPMGRRLETIVDMLLEIGRPAEAGVAAHPDREREIRRHVGDYALFMSGLFPEHVARAGGLDYFHEQGRLAYRAVSAHDRARYRPGAALFEALAAHFPRHAGAITYMRQVHFPRHAGRPDIASALRDLLR